VVSANMVLLAKFDGGLASRTLSGTVLKRAPAPVYLRAQILCPDKTMGSSYFTAIDPSRIKRAKKSVSLGEWITQLRKVLRKALNS
jgi:hypothetical protein